MKILILLTSLIFSLSAFAALTPNQPDAMTASTVNQVRVPFLGPHAGCEDCTKQTITGGPNQYDSALWREWDQRIFGDDADAKSSGSVNEQL